MTTPPHSPLWAKSDPALRNALKRLPEDAAEAFTVVVVLGVPVSAERFEQESRVFVRALEALGGQALERLWIASSIVARAPRHALEALAARGDVRQLILNSERDILLK